uniref:Uncharacterized protein n=1 Tax=Amphimedon queenslandica TaxID=400682 RepID=A0A1X7UFU8_AMPQE
KYDTDDWFGCFGLPGEWPVSNHGTTKSGAEGITKTGYDKPNYLGIFMEKAITLLQTLTLLLMSCTQNHFLLETKNIKLSCKTVLTLKTQQ